MSALRGRAWNGIAADDHDVRIGRSRIGEHSVECVDVAVDVVKGKDVHGSPC